MSRKRVHTPALLQMEAVECGAAALGIVLAHHGRVVPLAELRRVCGVSRDGSNAARIVAAAESYGLCARGFSTDIDDLREQAGLPCIAFWRFNHFVVIEGFGRGSVFVNDPAVGHRTVTLDEFSESFTGVVLTMEPGPDFERGGARPSALRGLRHRLRGFESGLGFAVLAGFLLVVPGLLIPAMTQVFVDEVLLRDRASWLRPLLFAMLLAVAVQLALRHLQLRCLRRLHVALAARMSSQFFAHLLRLPVEFYEQRFAGEIGSRARLCGKVARVLSGQLAQTAIDVVMMVFYAGLMLCYDVHLTLVGIACAALNFAALRAIQRRRVEANMRLLQETGAVTGASIAGLQSIETIKAGGMESGFFQRWSGLFASAQCTRQGIAIHAQVLNALPGLLATLATMAVIVIGGLYVIEGRMTIGMLIAFQILMASFLRPVGHLVGLGQTLQDLRGDLARLDDVLAHEPDASEAAPAGAPVIATRDRLAGRVELRDVTFGYDPIAGPLLSDFDLTLEPGQRIALVGGSGSGKTTVARLVCGLYQPWSGEVLLDGTPRRALPREVLSTSLAHVDQDVLLFGGTVRDNLTLWADGVSDETLVEACQDAAIYDCVRALPGGLDADLLEGGANLSGGERQRLEIARALVLAPSILVLDEATSALDADSERRIVDHLTRRGCTCLIVAHRLSTIRDCDEIVVMDGGSIAERGTHDELWHQDGRYAALLRAHDGAPALELRA